MKKDAQYWQGRAATVEFALRALMTEISCRMPEPLEFAGNWRSYILTYMNAAKRPEDIESKQAWGDAISSLDSVLEEVERRVYQNLEFRDAMSAVDADKQRDS